MKDAETLKKAFEPSAAYGKVKYVISALGASANSQESVEEV